MTGHTDGSRFAAAFLISFLAVSAPAAGDEIPAWAMAKSSVFTNAFNARDTEAFKTYFAEDAEVNGARGIEAILTSLKQEWAELDALCEDDIRSVTVVNDYAVLSGQSACWQRGGDRGGAELNDWLAVWKRSANGQWLSVLEQW